jgi:hypothetical protein
VSDGPRVERQTLVVAHHHPGRLRVRSGAFERDSALRESVARFVGEQSGVRDARAEARTGSVLVAYDPARADAGELLTAIAARAHLTIGELPRANPVQAIFDAAHALDEQMVEWSGGRFGLGFLVPLTMSVGSIGSFLWSAHTRAPRWDNLLFWGVQLFRSLNDDRRAPRREHANGA